MIRESPCRNIFHLQENACRNRGHRLWPSVQYHNAAAPGCHYQVLHQTVPGTPQDNQTTEASPSDHNIVRRKMVRLPRELTPFQAHASSSCFRSFTHGPRCHVETPQQSASSISSWSGEAPCTDVALVIYLDMWPFSLPILAVASPLAAYQLTQEHSQPKSDGLAITCGHWQRITI